MAEPSSTRNDTRTPKIAFAKYSLSNGLEVILHEDHATPIACVNIWYHVGSKNERPGRTGFAHLFEHMMFQGSKHWDDEYFAPLQEAGGTLNGSTNTDRTNYWEVVPSNFLERALWLEADRMGFLLDAMTQEKLDNQRDVVKNERRQNYENRPYGLARGILAEAAYPVGHPYSWLTIGSHEDLTAASLDDVKDFYRQFYNPSNATLVVAGDIDPAATRELIERQFGGLLPGPPVWNHGHWSPRIDGERRITAQDRVQLSRLYLDWTSVRFFADDDATLDIVGQILGGGKSSRLYERLVHEHQIAQDVYAAQISREVAGEFQIAATVRKGHDIDELTEAIDQEIARLANDGPDDAELQRTKNRIEASFIKGLDRVGGFGGVADQLNLYNHYVREPGYFETDLNRWLSVTADDVRRVTRAYLGCDRIHLSVVPMPSLVASTSVTAKSVDRMIKPQGGPSPSVTLPRPSRRTLANGLELIVIEHGDLPLLECNLVVGSGSGTDPAARHGLADLTAAMLDEGTASHTALEIAREMDGIGARLSLFAGRDTSGATLSMLTRHAPAALAIVADVLVRPTFPEDELERERSKRLTRLLQRQDQPDVLASVATSRVLFGAEHPYGHAPLGDPTSLAAIDRDQLQSFYRAHWRPESATLIVVGDIDADAAEALVTTALGDWQRGSAPARTSATKLPDAQRAVYFVDKPGATQSVVSIGHVSVARDTPDYFPLHITNAALGGMFSSRLNLNLREDKGYTYGARSSFSFTRLPGAFVASASVQTTVTREAIVEFFAELEAIRGPRPLTADEVAFAKNGIVRGFPRRFETSSEIASELRAIVTHGLADDYFNTYVAEVESVTVDDCNRVAREHIHPERAAIVIVGDGKLVRPELEKLGYGSIIDVAIDET